MQKKYSSEDVAQLYRKQSSLLPPDSVDELIRHAARETSPVKSAQRWFVPASIAASIILTVSVVSSFMFGNTAPQGVNKLPMHSMQRIKPAAPEQMIKRIEAFVDNGSIDEARALYRKYRSYYPEHNLNVMMKNKQLVDKITLP